MTPKTKQVHEALLKANEGEVGEGWLQVYLDNALPADMSPRSFAGHLSALEALGLYVSEGDDCFGRVRRS